MKLSATVLELVSHMESDRPFIASRKLMAIDASGREFEITIAIGEPYEASEGEWACPVLLEGLYDRFRDTRGIDSWQAMQLAYQMVGRMLSYFVEDGGRLQWFEEREPVSPEDLMPRLTMQG
jgi:hypothetical protein